MSRIGKLAIAIPKGVEVKLGPGALIDIKGPKGQSRLDYHDHVKVTQDDEGLKVARHSDSRQDRAFHGLYQRLLRNTVTGVSEGFQKELQLVGVGYRAMMEGKTLVMNLGYSHEVRYNPPEGVSFSTPEPTRIVVAGHDKQKVGQEAANIRGLRPPEPYKGKGIRYMDERVKRKVGKSGAKK